MFVHYTGKGAGIVRIDKDYGVLSVNLAQVLKHEPGAQANIEALLAEHVSIGLAGRIFDRLLLTSNIDSVHAREGLAVAGFAYIGSLRAHMWKEEKKLFPMANAVLTEEDWLEMEGAVDAIEDPLFGAEIAKGYERLYRLIIDQAELGAVAGSID